MTTISLSFYQRFHLENAVGGFPCPNIKAARTFIRLLDKVRLTEAERREAQFETTGSSASWHLPHPNHAQKSIELEDTEAQAFAQAIENFENVRVIDAEWLVPLLEQLEEQKAQQAAA